MRAARNPRFNASVSEPIAEACVCERSSKIIHEERHFAGRRRIDDPLQSWQDRQDEPLGLAIAPLELSESDFSVPNVLAAKSRNVRTPLSGKEQERESKPRFCTY